MSIRKRGERYQVRVRLGSGQRIERTLPTGATRADAINLENALRSRQIEAAAGRQPTRLISEALDRWKQTATSLKSWERDIRYRAGVLEQHWIAGKVLDDIPELADQIKAHGLANGLSPAAINRYLAILRRVANLAVQWGWTDKPLGRRVLLLPGERQRDALLTPEQVTALARVAGGEAGDCILFLSMTGLRRSEALGLTPDRISDGVLILTSNTKSGKARLVPLAPAALKIARKRLPWQIDAHQLRKAFERARKELKLPGVRLHDCRHAFGSWLAARGVSTTDIRDLMGHSSLTVTSRYLHSRAAGLKGAVGKLPKLGTTRRKAA